MSQKSNHDGQSKKELIEFQNGLLADRLKLLVSRSDFYKNQLAHVRDTIEMGRADFQQLPTTSKSDVEKLADDFLTVNQSEIVEYVTTSGTLGDPLVIALTKKDQERLAYNESRALAIAGVTKEDVIQITTTLDKRFMAGIAYYLGATALGAAVIRSGIGDMDFQIDNIIRFKPTVLIAVPSFVYKLSEYMLAKGIDPNSTSVAKIICIGEPIRGFDFVPNTLHEKITNNWAVQLFSTYASTEISTAFTECEAGVGGHEIPELIYTEILDEEGLSVAPGELGEITVTPFGQEAMPLLRYRTGDLARLHVEKCTCGRSTRRLGPIEGRKHQMIKWKGTTVYPQQIENALNTKYVNYLIKVSTDDLGLDQLVIVFSDQLSPSELEGIALLLAQKIRVKPIMEQASIDHIRKELFPSGSRKPKRFIDSRI